jgi:type III secretion protein V
MSLLQRVFGWLATRQEFILVGLLVLTMAMMFLPMPPLLADVLIAVNIAISVLLLMVGIHISRAADFSTLPSLILITTAFRLSLSITTSRMVLVRGEAGQIIQTFGEFVIAGNVLVGLVVYLIITIVQFLVISKGSERVAEVAARFTLDAMPGKQISIDTDLKNGDIDQAQARSRRLMLERESQLYGAMDGAMKFVKGDSIASLVIIVVNLVGGISIGCLQRGLDFSGAVQTYSLLAVGDGLIAQIPALLISLTAGVVVTRTTSDSGNNLGQEIVAQLMMQPRTFQVCAAVLVALAFVPGFPTLVFLALAALLGGTGWWLQRRLRREAVRQFSSQRASELAAPEPARLAVSLGGALNAAPEQSAAALEALRERLSAQLGLAVPRLRLQGQAHDGDRRWRLAINGIPYREGEADTLDEAIARLGQAVIQAAGQFIGLQETQQLLNRMQPAYADLIRELSKAAPLIRVAEVLRRLLNEGVAIVNLRQILEAVTEWAPREANTAVVAEHVRHALQVEICHAVANPDRLIPVLLIEPALDEALRKKIHATPAGTYLILDSQPLQRLCALVQAHASRLAPGDGALSIVAAPELRRHLRAVLARHDCPMPVLTHTELAPGYRLRVFARLERAQIFEPAPPIAAVPHGEAEPALQAAG